jgi:predicted permease
MTFQTVAAPPASNPDSTGTRTDSWSHAAPPVAPSTGPSPLAVALTLAFVIALVFVAQLLFAKKEAGAANGNAVVVTDVQMPFGSMVIFMVKWALASIPAMVILMIVGTILASTLGVLLLGVGAMFR